MEEHQIKESRETWREVMLCLFEPNGVADSGSGWRLRLDTSYNWNSWVAVAVALIGQKVEERRIHGHVVRAFYNRFKVTKLYHKGSFNCFRQF